jgi:hypothetical protein
MKKARCGCIMSPISGSHDHGAGEKRNAYERPAVDDDEYDMKAWKTMDDVSGMMRDW